MFESRGTKTGKKLWQLIDNGKVEFVMTDYWKAYTEFIPENIHVQSKAETYYNSLLRHYLARFRRKTKRYAKSMEK